MLSLLPIEQFSHNSVATSTPIVEEYVTSGVDVNPTEDLTPDEQIEQDKDIPNNIPTNEGPTQVSAVEPRRFTT